MNTQTPTATETGSLSQPRSRRRWRHALSFLGALAVTIALFYAEEDWRGRRAWENCQRELEAKGAVLDWSAFLPPPVPEDQNVFAVPEMQQWFAGRRSPTTLSANLGWPGPTELSKILNYPGWAASTNQRVVVADVIIGLPGSTPPSGFTVLRWRDATNAPVEATQLMREALGPMGMDPQGYAILARRPQEVRPAQIFLQCQTAPTPKELEQFFSKDLIPGGNYYGASEKVRVEAAAGNSYQLTMGKLLSAADYAAWGDSIEPDLAIIRQAVQRPYARLQGNYRDFVDMPVVNFLSMRIISQRLVALAECQLLLGQPDKAVKEMTLLNQVRRILEYRPAGKPMTLVSAMINVAITGLYVSWVEDGMRLQAWKEPQLAALQEQLAQINLRPYVADAFSFERAGIVHYVEISSHAEQGEFIWWGLHHTNDSVRTLLTRLIPQGWIDQNLVMFANAEQLLIEGLPPQHEEIVPHKIDTEKPGIDEVVKHRSPFNLLAAIAIPNFSRAQKTLAHTQTMVNQAQIACALERCRLSRGEYPPTLDALVPQFIEKIPPDLIGGQPPHYRRTEDGKFLLYSIGWTEQDHGGKSGSNGDGDWVWGDE
jgi:hypothetical protein